MENIRKFLRNMIVAIATVTMSMAAQAQDPPLAKGEILYKGTTKLEKCDEAIFSFVLTANKDTVKNFSLNLNGIYVRENSGRLSKVSSKSSYDAKAAVKNGSLDFKQYFGYFHITIKEGLGADIVTGELNCVYEVNRNQRENLGTAPIELRNVQSTAYSKGSSITGTDTGVAATVAMPKPPVPATSVRSDGVYCQAFSDYSKYLRFYEDGTIMGMSDIRTISQIKKEYFDRNNSELQGYMLKGKYTINGGQISFRLTTDTGPNAGNVVDYNGQIYEDRLILNSHVIKTGNKNSNGEFLFSAW
jgi:hypothetical protein